MKIPSAHNQVSQQPFNTQKNTVLTDGAGKQDSVPSFVQRLEDGLKQVADTQQNAATVAQNYELGLENDLAKVMVGQQVSSLAFQLTLNVRNKALSAYKDIMNMPV